MNIDKTHIRILRQTLRVRTYLFFWGKIKLTLLFTHLIFRVLYIFQVIFELALIPPNLKRICHILSGGNIKQPALKK